MRAALIWNAGGRSETELLDLRTGLLEPVGGGPGDVVTGLAFQRDGRALVLASEGPTLSPRISRVSLDRPGPAIPLLPAAPDRGGALVEPTHHELRADDGLRLSGWLFRPRGAPAASPPPSSLPPSALPLPMLIWLHGGPEAQERPTFQPLFQALLAEGVAVFAPNVRDSGGHGRAFTAADDRERRFAAINDVRAVVEFLVASGLADPARVAVAGRS